MATAPLSPARKSAWLVLAVCIVTVVGLGSLIGGLTSAGEGDWYRNLEKAPFNPPGYAFGIVWPFLYTFLGIAAWRIWRSDAPSRNTALGLFGAQLIVNYSWSYVFFTLQLIAVGAIWIVVMIALAAMAMRAFFKIDRTAGWLMAPYMAWISFAFVLTASIWLLNP
ncbi:MAG: TspO/MBR family protein [Pseudomonadota bacterium]